MTHVRTALFLFVGLTLTVASTARAETPEELFQRGRTLATQQRYAEACPLLAESVRVEPGIGARLWLAECYEKEGRLASALAEFKAAAAQARERGDERQKVALGRAAALDSRVPRIVIVSSGSLTLTLDDAPVAASVPEPVDSGLHTIVANAPGFTPWSVSVAVPDAGTVTVNVPVFEPAPEAPQVSSPAPAPAPPPAHAPIAVRAPSSGLAPLKIASIATGAIGLVALGGGTFLGLSAKSRYDSSNQDGHCVQDACDATGKDLRRSATSTATLSTIAFAGAGALFASSIVLFVLAPSTTVTPAMGPHEAGLSLARRF